MKKNLIALASAVVALMMSACVKDTTADIVKESGVTQTITASIEGMTRTSMEDFEVGQKADIVWSSGDKIGLVTESGSIVQATIKETSVGKEVAEFTISDTNVSSSTKYIYGFYPYQSGVTYADGKLSGVCLNDQRTFIKNQTEGEGAVLDGYGLTFNTNEMHMVAKPDANGNLVFKCSCGLVEVQLTADKAINFYNFTLHSDSKELSAFGTVDMTAENPVFVPYHMGTYNWNTIDAKKYGTHSAYMTGSSNNGKGVQVNNTQVTKLFFVVPVGTYDDLEIQVACPDLCVTKKSSKSHTVKRNVVLAFNPINVSQVSNLYTGSDVVDLSSNGCAFTYLVPTSASPKKYKFTAKMVGNTKSFTLPDGTVIKDMGTSTYNYNTTYVYAEDGEGVITDLRREKDIVYFTASKPGNAIIMIGNTGIGRLQQFHIWVSDAKDQALPGGHVFLNCNLGATYAPETLEQAKNMTKEQLWRSAGCLYQWGNPTPRPSLTPNFVPATYTSTSDVNLANWNETNSGWILHPWSVDPYSMNFFSSATSSMDIMRSRMYFNFYALTSNNTADGNVHLWWHGSKSLGDLRFGTKALWQETKTQFDPCPPGYRVPSKQEMLDAFTKDGSHSDKPYKNIPGGAGVGYTYNNQFVYIPYSGMRRPTSAALFNPAYSNYPRTAFWFFDSSLTSAQDVIDKYSGYCRYFYQDIKTKTNEVDEEGNPIYKMKNTQSFTDATIGVAYSYPACELANDATGGVSGKEGGWSKNYNTEWNAAAPQIRKYRYSINAGLSVRCIRDSKTVQQASVASSYNVDAAAGF